MEMAKFNRMLLFEQSGRKALRDLDSLIGLDEFKETIDNFQAEQGTASLLHCFAI